jgi:hypothetical protein
MSAALARFGKSRLPALLWRSTGKLERGPAGIRWLRAIEESASESVRWGTSETSMARMERRHIWSIITSQVSAAGR